LISMIRGNQQDYRAAIAARSRDQLEDQLRTVDDDITSIYDQLEHISENAQLNGISVTGRTREELEDMLIRLEIKKDVAW
jgi:flagellin-like hook-associated protein FlgL